MLKSDEILQKLEPDSKDVFVEGLIDTYTNRPDEMKNVCLANFASLYNVSKKKTDNAQITENSDDEDVIDNEIDEKTIALKMKNGKGWIKNRKKKKIIRYRNFKLHQDPENYYREQLMLFLPWINEEENLININHEETFELYKDLIQQKRSEYVHREANEFEQAFEDHTERENENDIDDKNIEYDEDKNEFLIYEIGNNEGDIFVQMGINTRTEKIEHFNVPKIIPDTKYQRMMRSLNYSQRKYTLNVMNLIKNGDKQFFHFINGGAEQLKRTAMDTIWGGEVQIQALSIALFHPIYSYIQFNSDPQNKHYISSSIELQELVDRFVKGTAGGRLKYIGYKSDMNKLGFCLYYNGIHYDALLPFQDNPQQFLPHFDLINMSL
ncbi:unnamed protein product [Rotaria socialis]